MRTSVLSLSALLALCVCASAFDAGASVGGAKAPDGTPVQVDVPKEWHLRNKGGSDGSRGPGSGSGLCVFTSIDHSARMQDVPQLVGFRDWMTNHPGGGYPEKVDQMVARICRERGMPPPQYLQVEGDDLEILRKACATGRVPGVTFGYSPAGRYNGQRISHMVSLVHADARNFAILDNNYPGNYEWMTPQEFGRTYTDTSGQGWAVILLAPGCPPFPKN